MAGTSLVGLAVLTKAPEKFPQLNHRIAKESMGKLGAQLRDGKISAAQFKTGMEKELRSSVTAGYRFQVGAKLNDNQLASVNGILERQGTFLDGFLKDVAGKDPGDWIASRAEQYAGAVREAENEGRFEALDDETPLECQGPDGDESCEDCLALLGEVRTVAEWRESGEAPGQRTCGDRCRCSLEAA